MKLFEFTDRSRARDADPDPAALAAVHPGWRVLVGRDHRPIGVRVTLGRADAEAEAPVLSTVLDGVLQALAFESDGQTMFPQGLVLLAPGRFEADAALSGWHAPRNVLLELGQSDLEDERQSRRMFEMRKHGVRVALRLERPEAAAAERLKYFQYLVADSRSDVPPDVDPANASIVTLQDATRESIDADFAAGLHATAGWPLTAIRRAEPRGLAPAQTAVFELIRLVQADAGVRDLERVFKGEPLLAYLLLTLANSAAFRRPAPVSSLGHAISLLGYQRLIKWLVLLLAIAGKYHGTAPLVFVAVARGHLLENLAAAAGRSQQQRDDAFVIGTFSLLDAITGQPLSDLLRDIHLPEAISEALLAGQGPYAPLLQIARAFESSDPLALVRTQAELGVDAVQANQALLRALAAADSFQSLLY